MQNTKFIQIAYAAAILVIWLVIVVQFQRVLTGVGSWQKTEKTAGSDVLKKTNPAIIQALEAKPALLFFKFKASPESPFAVFFGQGTKNNTDTNRKRSLLFLNGVLMKEKPLAILIDESGTTAICAVGDTFKNQVVTAIRNDAVVLRDKKGPYEISVLEK